ncbi:uncharacterized protein LOC108850218 [Raphanus sativus]|uniref:Uncharacterized protein LOC108850218 n=1 Tax=Raphanus sativus TaxID=3726 RepID=A0A6J0N3Q4_RAPSA|nr:uncharacterized protein LOC108850218 [Raphanus sativus]
MGEGDQSSVTKSGTTDSRSVANATPYSLHASDNPGAMITLVTLTGENYSEWSSEMTNALRAKRKLGFVDGSIPKPLADDTNLELWLSVNSMIVGWIRTSIEPRVRSTVTLVQDSHKLWENLRKRFSVGNKVRVHHLKEQLASCRQDGQPVIEFFGRLSKLWEELDMYSPLPSCTCSAALEIEKAREAEKMHQFVMGLDETRFGGICQSIISSDSEMDIGEIYAKVVREEQRLNSAKDRETQQNTVGFATKAETEQATSRPGSVSSGVSSGRRSPCAHCGRTGHDKTTCWQLIGYPDWWEERAPSNRGSGGASRGGSRGGRGRGSPGFDRSRNTGTRMINERARPSSDKLSGKTRHGDLILDTGASHHMTGDFALLVNTSAIPPCPVGFADGNKTFATHIGNLPLTDRVTLEKDRFTRTLIGAGRERDGVYYFQDVMAARVHRMTGSVGPYRTRSSSGAVYFLTIVDDYSRAVWTYLLLEKSEVKTVLQNFCTMTHQQFGKPVKIVRSDNGTEFTCLGSYFRQHGVVHQTSCVATPQQNGRVERKHRHILNVSRALLFQSKLPVKFWGEAVMTAAHVINRTPTKVLQGRSPYEILYGTKPQYEHLRVFGSLCYTHHRSRDRDKFGPRSRRCIFVGYPFGQKGWKVYDLEKKEFIISLDVVFYETEFPMASALVSPQPSLSSPTAYSDDDWLLQAESEQMLDERGSINIDLSHAPEPVTDDALSSRDLTETEHTTGSLPPLPVFPAVSTTTQQPPEEVLGRGQRVRAPPVKFRDYVAYNTACIHTHLAPTPTDPSVSSNSVSGKTPYPLVEYLSDLPFSPSHRAFLAAVNAGVIPKSYKEAVKQKVWRVAVKDEVGALEDQGTWDVTDLPPGKVALGSHWIFTIKYN